MQQEEAAPTHQVGIEADKIKYKDEAKGGGDE